VKLRRIRQLSAYNPHNKIRLVQGGREYFECLEELINNARQFIHLQTYLIDPDETGLRIIDALKRAARRGVKVQVLCDGYATKLPDKLIEEIREAGIQFRLFEPLFNSEKFYFGRRLHHKVFVADEFHSLVGGINIANRYNDINGRKAWFDMAIYTQGQTSALLHEVCNRLWKRKDRKLSLPFLQKRIVFRNTPSEALVPVRIRRNDWIRGYMQITQSYAEFISNAEKSIIIVSSYFIPGRIFRMRLAAAARRGVKIRVILAGISDVKIAKLAERYLYDWLLRNQIDIYEYQPSVLHAKAAVFDSAIVTLGSYNINNLSAFASIELNLDIKDSAFASSFESKLENVIQNDCRKITRDDYARIGFFTKIRYWFAHVLLRLILFLFTNNLKRERRMEEF
jgi:cardiolipin synthase